MHVGRPCSSAREWRRQVLERMPVLLSAEQDLRTLSLSNWRCLIEHWKSSRGLELARPDSQTLLPSRKNTPWRPYMQTWRPKDPLAPVVNENTLDASFKCCMLSTTAQVWSKLRQKVAGKQFDLCNKIYLPNNQIYCPSVRTRFPQQRVPRNLGYKITPHFH